MSDRLTTSVMLDIPMAPLSGADWVSLDEAVMRSLRS